MTLIFIFITLVIDFIAVDLERFRRFNWFISLYRLLNNNYINNKFWDSSYGLLALLSIPIVLFSLVLFLLSFFPPIIEAIFILFILVYCIAPKRIFNQFNNYIISIEKDDVDTAIDAELLINKDITDKLDTTDVAIMKSVFVETHKQILAAIFWYLMLGITGVFMYRLVEKLHDEIKNDSTSLSESTSILLSIIEWPSTRVFAIGLALAGNLVSATMALKKSDIFSLDANYSLLTSIGIGALQYSSDSDVLKGEKAYWLNQFKLLIIRTFIILIIFIAIMILSGIN